MSGTAGRNRYFCEMSPAIVARLIDQGALDCWPFELSKRGMVLLKRFPENNVGRRMLFGDVDECFIGSVFHPSGATPAEAADHGSPMPQQTFGDTQAHA